VASINSIKKLFPMVRQDSKAPTFALTYQGTYRTLMKNLGFDKDTALGIEANYHELYIVSDQWVQMKLDEASKTGYVELAFGLRLRTPLLSQTLRGHKTTPYEAEAEGRTAGNALGQSYGLLNNRAAVEFMRKVWDSPYRLCIKPVGLIHDAIYLVILNNTAVIEWVNRELIKSMQWQDLPEIQHDTVKLGANLSVFWPSWAYDMELPNNCRQSDIFLIAQAHQKELLENAA
jgi:DNA polymerase-1